MTRNQQGLLYKLITCYANYVAGNDPDDKVSDYSMWQAKKDLKNLYLKSIEWSGPSDPIQYFEFILQRHLPKGTDGHHKVMDAFLKALQMYLYRSGDFSLSLKALSDKGATALLTFLIEYLLDNGVPLSPSVLEMLEERERRQYVYALLLARKCIVCGKEGADLHHHDPVGSAGYKSDTGTNHRVAPLCRYHHSEWHAIGPVKFKAKYTNYEHILLTEIEVIKLINLKTYPNHFQGFVMPAWATANQSQSHTTSDGHTQNDKGA